MSFLYDTPSRDLHPLSLHDALPISNRESADLFLSVHANASANATAHGVETYFLNFALNPQAEAVAARENAASRSEEHTSELQSPCNLVCRLLLEKKKTLKQLV